jgi:hypothetical protein
MSKGVSGILIVVIGLITGLIYLGCGGGSSGSGGDDSPNVAFTTSVTGNGNLSTWADADGNASLAAADAVCQARADAAGLSGTFVAWMSDSTDDAYCRVLGLSGKVSPDNCGQATLPTDAGPWIRTDGFAFAATISQMSMGVIYTPLRYDEFGSSVPASSYVFTATDLDGTLRTDSCSDWSSSTSGTFGTSGLTETTGSWWTSSGATDCSDDIAIMCMETGPGEALPAFASSGQLVFVSSIGGNGDLSVWPGAGGETGVAAGDAVCRNLANTAGFANTVNFKAWLSDSGNSAVSRLAGGPWVRPDGVKIANDTADLTDGELFAPINVMDTLQYNTGSGVWTGTLDTGAIAASMCSDWANSSAQGTFGSAVYADGNWTDQSQLICSGGFYHIYCFEGL